MQRMPCIANALFLGKRLARRRMALRAFSLLSLLTTLRGVAPLASARLPRVLVLGSGGFLGSALVEALQSVGTPVAEVRGRAHVDLRSRAALDAFAAAEGPFSFVFFLACEVGGAKFLSSEASQAAILRHNVQIYEAVLPWARDAGLRLLFTSSSMRHLRTGAYAAIKALGEEYLGALGHFTTRDNDSMHVAGSSLSSDNSSIAGAPVHFRSARLYNLYGRERVSPRSHVLSDWAAQCARDGVIVSISDGAERRQFLHVSDAAAALVALWAHWDSAWPPGAAGEPLDVTSGEWVQLSALARRLSTVAASRLHLSPCPMRVVDDSQGRAAAARPEIEPMGGSPLHAHWRSWMPPAAYPPSAPLPSRLRDTHADASEPTGAPSQPGLGWVDIDDGLEDLLRYHVGLLEADERLAARDEL